MCGRPAVYGTVGSGPPLVFLHGWALNHRAYARSLSALADLGVEVFAPTMPGCGGTAELPPEEYSMAGYARWVAEFIRLAVGQHQVVLVGHSFGGGVAIQTAHDSPDLVRMLVVVNSIGGSAWAHSGSTLRSMAERPLWDWGIHFPADILPLRQVSRVLPVILRDAVPNLLRNPAAVWRQAGLARRADLAEELDDLKERGLPVIILWGEQDRIIPRLSADSLQEALGGELVTVNGNHSWLLADPKTFGEVMTNVVAIAQLAADHGPVAELTELAASSHT